MRNSSGLIFLVHPSSVPIFPTRFFQSRTEKYVAGGLTQAQLDEVTVNMDDPPDLTGLVEVGSRKPLVWSARPSNDDS